MLIIRLAGVLAGLATSLAFGQGTAEAFVAKIPAASMTSSVILSLGAATGSPGSTVLIPINLTASGKAAPAAFQLDLAFDTQQLTFAGVQAGVQLTAANKSLSSAVLANGNVRLLASGMNQTTIANGLTANVSFTLNTSFVLGSSTVSALNCVASNGLGGLLSTGCAIGSVKSLGCDLNGDGSVNVGDVQLLVTEALGLVPPVHDLNRDNAVNVIDVQQEILVAMGGACSL